MQLYPGYAGDSPFLLDSLDSYFLGGIDDMATWTDNIWTQTITMLVNGTEYAIYVFYSLCTFCTNADSYNNNIFMLEHHLD